MGFFSGLGYHTSINDLPDSECDGRESEKERESDVVSVSEADLFTFTIWA